MQQTIPTMSLHGGARRARSRRTKKKTTGTRSRRTKPKKAPKKVRPSTEKRRVWTGRASKTPSGLKKKDLVQNKSGKIVSKKKSMLGKKHPWIRALAKARNKLGIRGFVKIGKDTEGKQLLDLARMHMYTPYRR